LDGFRVPSDPAYQRLAATSKQVRNQLNETVQAQLRRAICSGPQEAAAKRLPETDDTEGTSARGQALSGGAP
jgi:hypothetical protein